MMNEKSINPNDHRDILQAYVSRSLGSPVRLVRLVELTASSRAAPWRMDVEVNGIPRSLVLRLDARFAGQEYAALKAMGRLSFPAPRAYGWDSEGEVLGVPCFLCDFIEGESFLEPVLAGEDWAVDLYLDSVCALQGITAGQLAGADPCLLTGTSPMDVLEEAHAGFQSSPNLLAEALYNQLQQTLPNFPALCFSNGDLWLENFIARDHQLAGVIDFQHAGFSDPLFEFLLSFFVSPGLRGRGIEEHYCARMGIDPGGLHWYHGLEYYEVFEWVIRNGKPFTQYTAEVLESAIEEWLAQN